MPNTSSKVAALLASLSSGLDPMEYDENHAVRGRYNPVTVAKTRKGATHIVNPTFRSRSVLPITPAQYRHFHFAKKDEHTKLVAKMVDKPDKPDEKEEKKDK